MAYFSNHTGWKQRYFLMSVEIHLGVKCIIRIIPLSQRIIDEIIVLVMARDNGFVLINSFMQYNCWAGTHSNQRILSQLKFT